METKKQKLTTKELLKANFFGILSFIMILTGGTYAAWDSMQSNGSVITATDWNNMVSYIKGGGAGCTLETSVQACSRLYGTRNYRYGDFGGRDSEHRYSCGSRDYTCGCRYRPSSWGGYSFSGYLTNVKCF